MPNWCQNKLKVTHEDDSMMDRFVNAYMNNKLCSEFLPPIDEDTVEWRVANWAQKCDIGPGESEEYGSHPTVVDNEASLSFSTAWTPPVGLYERLAVLGFDVQASYFEPGMSFVGIWDNGKEEYYQGEWDEFPKELYDEFNMEKGWPLERLGGG